MKSRSFRATLEKGTDNLNWTIIRLPSAAKWWGARGQIRVRGEINGFPFRTTLFPTGTGEHVMIVNKKMQAGARVKAGGAAAFRVELDTEEREAVIPAELEAIFAEDRALRRWYEQFNLSNRSEIGKWIMDVKSDGARARRAEQMAERMLSAMDAERELPPVLKIALANDPVAFEQWKKISTSHRRSYLMAVFYYRDPQSRARRIGKMLEQLRARGRKVE